MDYNTYQIINYLKYSMLRLRVEALLIWSGLEQGVVDNAVNE